MIDTNDVRAAFAAIAEEAPPAERVRAGLAARGRVQRQRRTLLRVAGAGGLALSAGVVGYATTRPERRAPPPADEPPRGWLKVPFRYGPGWLPAGIGLQNIRVMVDGAGAAVTSRMWQQPVDIMGYITNPTVLMSVGSHPLEPVGDFEGAKTFDINGVEGKLKIRAFGDDDALRDAEVAWQPPGGPPMRIRYWGAGTYEEDDPLLRIARSVRHDRRHTWVGPRFGWLPDDIATAPWWVYVFPEGGRWAQRVETDLFPIRPVRVEMGWDLHRRTRGGGQPVPQRVRGLDGVRIADERLYFTLPDGVQVNMMLGMVGGQEHRPTLPDLLRIAEEFDFGIWPDISWVGSR